MEREATYDIVAAIVPDPHAGGRFAVVVDGRPLAVLPLDVIERLQLRVGASVAATRPVIDREAASLKTYDRAVAMLTARARSARDLERQLVRKGEPPDFARAAIERLLRAGFLDDAGFARQFARSKALGAGLASRRLRQELARRGVDRRLVDEAVDEVLAEESIDERTNAEVVARKRLRTLGDVDPDRKRRRLYAFLARRGYDSTTIVAVLDTVLGGSDEDTNVALADD